jgi:hypothetical protein
VQQCKDRQASLKTVNHQTFNEVQILLESAVAQLTESEYTITEAQGSDDDCDNISVVSVPA